jgi:hypothetical protein
MATELIELGTIDEEKAPGLPPAFRHLEEFVLTFEDPLAKVKLQKKPSDAFLRAVDRMQAISARNRLDLISGKEPSPKVSGLGDIGFLDFSAIGGALSSIAAKVTSVAGSPGFMTSLASAASFIPKVGPQVGGLLASLAPKNPNAVITAAGTAGAASQAFGLPGNVIGNLPEPFKSAAAKLAGQMAPQAQAGGSDLMSMLLKSVGQFVAVQTLSQGAGVSGGVGGMGDISNLIRSLGGQNVQSAIKAGENDLLNAAALGGGTDAARLALERGTPSSFPWVPVGVAAGGLLLVVTTLVIAGRGQ